MHLLHLVLLLRVKLDVLAEIDGFKSLWVDLRFVESSLFAVPPFMEKHRTSSVRLALSKVLHLLDSFTHVSQLIH